MPQDSDDTFDARATLEIIPEQSRAGAPLCQDLCLVEQDQKSYSGGCMVCGASINYEEQPRDLMCHYCMQVFTSGTACESGHHVCDACHVKDSLDVMEHICLTSSETAMVALFKHIRSHRAVTVHGPEHHAMVAAVVLTTYRNLGGEVTDKVIQKAIKRGAAVAGGSCGLSGVCGAASGVGIAFAALIGSTPKKAAKRQQVLQLTAGVLEKIASLRAARCCQRDAYLALRQAAEISPKHLGVQLLADEPYPCEQTHLNKQCAEDICPLWQGEVA